MYHMTGHVMSLPLYSIAFPIPTFPTPLITFPLDPTHQFRHVFNCLIGTEYTFFKIGLGFVAEYTFTE